MCVAWSSHVGIVGTAAAFGHGPIDILCRILAVAGLAMDAVLRVDLETRLAIVGGHHLLNASPAAALPGLAIEPQGCPQWRRMVSQLQDETPVPPPHSCL